jgi:hypothetical protein
MSQRAYRWSIIGPDAWIKSGGTEATCEEMFPKLAQQAKEQLSLI